VVELANCQSVIIGCFEQYICDVKMVGGDHLYAGKHVGLDEFLRCKAFLEANDGSFVDALVKEISRVYGCVININDIEYFLGYKDFYFRYCKVFLINQDNYEESYKQVLKLFRSSVNCKN
jgi:hypothetical protein